MKRIHYISGITLALFTGLHLFNHCYSIAGAESHIAMMNNLRPLYRNVIVETLLLTAVGVQIISGTGLILRLRKAPKKPVDQLHIWTGIYLAFFFIVHICAVMAGRYLLHVDTNFYYGAAGLNTFPLSLFFLPYYGLAVFSFFGHIAAVHAKKMKQNILGLSPSSQAAVITIVGIALSFIILYGLTGHFKGIIIPPEYKLN